MRLQRAREEEIDNVKHHLNIGCKDIYLRQFLYTDLDQLFALTQQKEITDLLPDWISTKEQRERWLLEDIDENDYFLESVPNIGDQCLRLAIVLKETDEMIGWCCTGVKDDLTPPSREIAYAISKDHRGKGYTTQAAKGLVEYLFQQTDATEVSAIALLRNLPSNRVIEKCGFQYVGKVMIGAEEFNHYRINK